MMKIEAMRRKDSQHSSGQTLVEFMLLFALILGLSLGLLKLVNGHIGKRWTALGNKIIGPSSRPSRPLTLR